MSKIVSIIGFLILALSPSFIDYQQSPDLRAQIVLYYVIGITFIFIGLDGWRN